MWLDAVIWFLTVIVSGVTYDVLKWALRKIL